jgi:hypothetical protein
MTANSGAEAALAEQAVLRLLDERRQVWTTATVSVSACARAGLVERCLDASATCTVFASELLVTVSVSAGLPFVRA